MDMPETPRYHPPVKPEAPSMTTPLRLGIAGLGSLAATLLLLARWPRLRLRKG